MNSSIMYPVNSLFHTKLDYVPRQLRVRIHRPLFWWRKCRCVVTNLELHWMIKTLEDFWGGKRILDLTASGFLYGWYIADYSVYIVSVRWLGFISTSSFRQTVSTLTEVITLFSIFQCSLSWNIPPRLHTIQMLHQSSISLLQAFNRCTLPAIFAGRRR